ncbi:30S ribosomal protein S16 [bacterium]|nr:30S ribosomal protein S16 [bacterium]
MRRMGSRKRPFYRLVAADSRYQRDGRFLEILGYYDPMEEPFKFKVDREKVVGWLNKGATMSETAEGLLRREGIVQAFNMSKAGSKADIKSDAGKKEEAIGAGESKGSSEA